MKLRILTAVLAGALLGGCSNTDWDHALTYAGLGDSNKPTEAQVAQAEAAAPAPVAAPAPDGWCEEVAKATQTEAAEQGFDAATQQRRAQVAFDQCSRTPAKR